jgi:serine/threonine protein kinase
MNRVEKIRLINKQLAQETEELHSLMMSRPPSTKHKVTLSALYTIGEPPEPPVPLIGKGDDGRVLRIEMDGRVIAVKIIDKYPNADNPKTRAFIARDQAYREFKALQLIGTHPNFFQLYSTELDEFNVTTEECDDKGDLISVNHEAWAIRMSFEANLKSIEKAKNVFGFNHKSSCVEARCASAVLMHILSQMADALRKLTVLGIRHRDLDVCNIMLVVPEMTLKIFDFSRADLPVHDIESPNVKMQSTYALPVEEYENGVRNEIQKTNAMRSKQSLFMRAYNVPATLNPGGYLTAVDEPSDFEALHKRIAKDLTLSDPVRKKLVKNHTSIYEKYDNRTRHFLLGRWLPVKDLPAIDRADYEEYLGQAVQLYKSLLANHGTLEDALKYLKRSTSRGSPPLTLTCDLADTSDPVNADWVSDDLKSITDELIQIGDANSDYASLLDLAKVKNIARVITADGTPTPSTEQYIRNTVDPFIQKRAHRFGSSEDRPVLKLFYKLKRVLARMQGDDSLMIDHFG